MTAMDRFEQFTQTERRTIRTALGRMVDSLDPDEDPEYGALIDSAESLLAEAEAADEADAADAS